MERSDEYLDTTPSMQWGDNNAHAIADMQRQIWELRDSLYRAKSNIALLGAALLLLTLMNTALALYVGAL